MRFTAPHWRAPHPFTVGYPDHHCILLLLFSALHSLHSLSSDDCHMGNHAELCAGTHGFTKELQDAHADESYRRAREASFADEIVPVVVKCEPELYISCLDTYTYIYTYIYIYIYRGR